MRWLTDPWIRRFLIILVKYEVNFCGRSGGPVAA